MNSKFHDPREHVRGIHQIFASDKKRIGFLFGAGTSFATGFGGASVPTIEVMTQLVVDALKAESPKIKDAISAIQIETAAANSTFNVESLLSTLETKRSVIAAGTLNGLNLDDFARLATLTKGHIIKLASIHKTLATQDKSKLAHVRFAKWATKARRRFATEVFTTNYDYLFEIALESLGMPYFDGFSGTYEPFYCPEAVEDLEAYPQLLKLWKMHGSLGWKYREADRAVVIDKYAETESILIFPSHLKYSTSKKQPYVGLIDRLCAFLQQNDAVLFTCGYSFGDPHINERMITSLRRGANSHVIALLYDETRDAAGTTRYALEDAANVARRMATQDTAGKMSVFGLRHAVIGGQFGEWKLRNEPQKSDSIRVSQYFDEDAATPNPTPGAHKGDEAWQGTGRFVLPDFPRMTDFLDDLASTGSSALESTTS